jgi:hypothetical protein
VRLGCLLNQQQNKKGILKGHVALLVCKACFFYGRCAVQHKGGATENLNNDVKTSIIDE